MPAWFWHICSIYGSLQQYLLLSCSVCSINALSDNYKGFPASAVKLLKLPKIFCHEDFIISTCELMLCLQVIVQINPLLLIRFFDPIISLL